MMKILIISLGCDKNLVDTEKMMAGLMSGLPSGSALEREGIEFTDDEEQCDAVLVNTCCFIGDAKVESIDTLIQMGELKKNPDYPMKYLIAAGCLVKRYRDEMLKEIPEIDGLVDLNSLSCLGQMLSDLYDGKTICQEDYLIPDQTECMTDRIQTTGGYSSYLKIADGCDKHCTYCVIPKVRGAYRSYPMESLLEEAQKLAESGVKELILVAQEITCYGTDLYGEKRLPELLHGLCRIEGLQWIRLLYCYPEEITDELIDVIRDEKKIVHYIDMPIQHASDPILKRMGRRTDSKAIREVIGKLRKEIPDIAIRTTLISGFPGETEEDHEAVLEFVDEMEFDRLGVFAYSREEDTPADLMPDHLEEEVKQARRNEIMELQQEIAFEKGSARIGTVMDVMIEGKVSGESAYVGRSYMDAPGIDGLVFVHAPYERILMSGDIVPVTVTGSDEYDLIGELQNESAE